MPYGPELLRLRAPRRGRRLISAVPDRSDRVEAALAGDAGALSSEQLCVVTRDVIGVSGAGVMLMSDDVPGGSLCTTDDVSALIEDLQYTLGEGPCVDAYRHERAVLEPDLADPTEPRWLAFTPPAVEAGVRAIFAFPLVVGSVRLGALDLYRTDPGPLTDDQHDDALAMADAMTHWVLDVQADAAPGSMSERLRLDDDVRFVVHNAAGAVSVQLGVSVPEAMARMRAYAFRHDRLLRDVADDVIARRLRFDGTE